MDHYKKLSRDIEAGNLTPDASRLTRDPKAGERILLEAAGAETWEEFEQMQMGRPRVGENRGPSPVIQTRIPHALKEQLETYATDHGQKASEVVREALTRFLRAA